MIIKSLSKAEKFVANQQKLGNDVRWVGWDIVFFRPEPAGIYSKSGAFRGGQWGFENHSPIEPDGTWRIDNRNVRHSVTTRD